MSFLLCVIDDDGSENFRRKHLRWSPYLSQFRRSRLSNICILGLQNNNVTLRLRDFRLVNCAVECVCIRVIVINEMWKSKLEHLFSINAEII